MFEPPLKWAVQKFIWTFVMRDEEILGMKKVVL